MAEEEKAFDLLSLAAAFARKKGISLNDPELVQRFFADAGPRLAEALANPGMLRGARAERLPAPRSSPLDGQQRASRWRPPRSSHR